MKLTWSRWLALVMMTAMVGSANAQQWDQPSQLGSYESILSRAGYSQPQEPVIDAPPAAEAVPQWVAPVAPLVDPVPAAAAPAWGGMAGGPVGAGGSCDSAACQSCDTAVACGGGTNRVGSLFGLVMDRNYEDNVHMAYSSSGQELYSHDVDNGAMVGIGASLIQRNCGGCGWEAVFWGIEDEADVTLGGPTTTRIYGLEDLNHVPSGADVRQVFDAGTDARFYRDTEIYNFEFNLLRNGGNYTTRCGWCGTYELLGGFRYLEFDESLRYVSNTAAAGYPTTTEYMVGTDNTLLGLQLGGRNEICIRNRLRFSTMVTCGLFNNRVDSRQQIFDETGYSPLVAWGADAGRSFDYSDRKDELALLGQLDLGLIYQMTCNLRARVGYRAMGVSGVALAGEQIPREFTDSYLLQRANTNGSLMMHGIYFGSEFCF